MQRLGKDDQILGKPAPHIGADRAGALHIVLVEDSESDTEILLRELRKGGVAFDVERVETAEALAAALEKPCDAVISDFRLPRLNGREALEIVRSRHPDLAFIMVSGTVDEEVAVEMLRAGANDYLMKDNLARLVPALIGQVRAAEEKRARKEADAKLVRLNRVYAVLSGINSAIVRIRDRRELFRESCRIAAEAGQLRLAWIGVVDAQKEVIVPMAFSGPEQGFLSVIRLSTREDSDQFGMAGRAVRARVPAVSNDVLADERARFRKESAQRGFRSLAMIPLVVDGATFGVLGLHAAEPRFFNQDEMKLLMEVAGNIEFALEHIDKEEKLRRLTRVQAVLSGINALIVRVNDREELCREACRIAVEAGKFPKAWIGLMERDPQRVKLAAGHGADGRFFENLIASVQEDTLEGNGVVAQAIRQQQPVIANDVENDPRVLGRENAVATGSRSLVVLPLVVANVVAGVLVLHAEVARFFDETEMKVLQELAGDISFAIDHIEKAERLNYLAYYDALTGLANRALFQERLEQKVSAARTAQRKLAVAMVDIERFKTINDAYGWQAGDALLQADG